MLLCSNCGHQNPDELAFCLNCATALGVNCPTCGQAVAPGNKFCGQCGARLPEAPAPAPARQTGLLQSLRALMPAPLAEKIAASAPQIAGERREVTVVFLDISNFTAAAHALDSEEVYLFVDEAMRRFVDVIYKYEGTIDKFTGDGLMALFGVPLAHENDPERAVRAALEMQAVLQPVRERVRQKDGFDIQARIGIKTGLVVAGQVGKDLHMEFTVIGDTVNVASRLQTAAQPGTILVSFSTYQRTQPVFQYRKLEPFAVKGIPELIQAYQPLGLLAKPGRVRGLAGLDVPMIGRQNQLARVQSALDAVTQQRQCQVVLITGEAGLGKSRLAAEFRGAIDRPEVSVYQGSCLAYARSHPMWIVAEVLRSILGMSEMDPADHQHEAIRAYFDKTKLPSELLPYLSNLLGLAQMDPEAGARLQQLDASMLQRQTHAALRQILLAEAQRAPTVLVFDDLHWVDPASRDFLEYAIQTISAVPLLLILVSRDSERKTVIRSLIATAEQNADQLVDIQLQPLTPAESRSLVEQLLPATPETVQQFKQRIAERADGNPFFLEEIVRMLRDQGGLTHEADNWQWAFGAEDLLHDVPGTLKGLILARFDRLPEGPRQTLQKAAVLGRSFPTGLLHKLDPGRAETIAADIGQLEERQFLVQEPFGSQAGFAFRHALVQEAVYSTLLKRDRQRIHEQIARAIEGSAFWPPEEQSEILAHHFAESPTPSRAVPYLIAAAENAARRYANETAAQHYRRAITLMGEQTAGQSPELAGARLGLGQALKFVGNLKEARSVLSQAVQDLEHHRQAGAEAALALLVESLRELADVQHREGALDEAIRHLEVALDVLSTEQGRQHSPLWRSLMDRKAWVRFRQGRLDEAFEIARHAIAGTEKERARDAAVVASLYNTLGGISWQRGDLVGAAEYVANSLALYEALDYSWGMANAYTNLGILYSSQGLWPKAVENFERSDLLRREVGYLPGRAGNLQNLGELRLAMGDHEQAQRAFEISLEISRQLGEDLAVLQAEVSLTHLALTRSQFEDAAAHVEAAENLLANAGEDQVVQVRLLRTLLLAGQGELDEAMGLAAGALQEAQAAGLLEEEADCQRVIGVLHGRSGHWPEAERHLQESLALSNQHKYPYRKGQALHELGLLYTRWGRDGTGAPDDWRSQAAEAYQAAGELFETLGARHDLAMARAALADLQTLPKPDMPVPPAQPAGVPEGQWHPAAVIWLNLSPRPGADDEDVFEALAVTLPVLAADVQAQEGHLIRRPSGLTAVFGAQTAHEDDAERAVQAAHRMLEHLKEPGSASAAQLTVRLVVSYGQVLAGYVGAPGQTSLVVSGDPVQLAQEAAGRVPAGTVWVTQAARDATAHAFDYAAPPADEASLLGSLRVWHAVKAKEQPGLARGLPGTAPRLVGRETPLEAMADLVASLQQGAGGLIWIEGEAGIGKSRLMREFAASVAAQGITPWTGQCFPQRSGHAFSLMSNLLARVFKLQGTDTADQTRAKIDRTLAGWPPGAQPTRPYMELLMGLEPTGPEGQRLAGLEPDQLRQQIFVVLRSLFKDLSAERPLVLLLDDLHWIDPLSADLFLFLSNLIASAPILFVFALRWDESEAPDERLIKTQSLLRPDQTLRLYLDRLSDVEGEALLHELLPAQDASPALQTYVLEKSEGNPYYLEEIVRVLMERGYLKQQPDRWEIDPTVDLQALPLPTSLGALIHARLDTLPDAAMQLLQCAAVLGGVFEERVLEEVWGAPNVRGDLVRLEHRGMLRRAERPAQWQFSHSLVETAVYNAMLKIRRQPIHLKVAEVLERFWAGAGTAHAEQLAFHFAQAEAWERALPYLVAAAEQAAKRYANEEALSYFQQASQMLERLPQAGARLHWRVAVGLGDVHRFVGEYSQSKAALEAGLALLADAPLTSSQRAGLHRRLGETAHKQGELDVAEQHLSAALAYLQPPADVEAQVEAARTLAGLAWAQLRQGRLKQAQQAGQDSLEHARRADSLSELATAENLLGGIYHQLGDQEQALHHTREAMALRERMSDIGGVAATSSNLAILAILAGDWPEAKARFARSLELREEIGDVEGVAIAHNNLGLLARDQGEFQRAESHFKSSLAVAAPLKMTYHLANANMGLADIYLGQAKLGPAHHALQAGLAQAEAVGAQDVLSEMYRIQAEILSKQNARDQGRAFAHKSASLAGEVGDPALESAAWRVLSEIELQAGQPQAARAALDKAWKAVAGVTSQLEAARVAAQAARIGLAAGEADRAEQHIRDAQAVFERLGAQADLERVLAALGQLPQRS